MTCVRCVMREPQGRWSRAMWRTVQRAQLVSAVVQHTAQTGTAARGACVRASSLVHPTTAASRRAHGGAGGLLRRVGEKRSLVKAIPASALHPLQGARQRLGSRHVAGNRRAPVRQAADESLDETLRGLGGSGGRWCSRGIFLFREV